MDKKNNLNIYDLEAVKKRTEEFKRKKALDKICEHAKKLNW